MSQLLVLPSPNGKLVFGLEWLPLIGRRTESRAYRAARQYRSTHLVIDGPDSAAVGLISLDGADARGGQAMHSAARAVANLHASGTVALCLPVTGGMFWVVGVHEGTVITGTDRLYPTREQAGVGLNGLGQAFPHLRVLDAKEAHQGMDVSSEGSWFDAIPAACDGSTVLRRVRGGRRHARAVALALALLCVFWVSAPTLWGMVFADERGEPVARLRIDPVAAWAGAVARARRGHVVHGVSGTRRVLQAFHDLPVTLAGWSLASAQCLAKHETWRCKASYRRASARANNASFLKAARKSWAVAFPSLDSASPSWEFASGAQPLERFSPNSARYNDRHLVSRFQAISPAFSRLHLGKAVPYPVPAPVDGDGTRIPRPASQARALTRPVRISGPLRSASVLLPYAGPIEWTKVHLAVGPERVPGLVSSQLIVSFEGVLHETESRSSDHAPAPAGAAQSREQATAG